jgi:hypothetical protein
MYNLTKEEEVFLSTLDTPSKIQDFLDTLSFNHEEHGETCMSPRRVLRERKAHCVEGALLASTCLLLQNRQPLIVSLRVTENDYDHVITIYKENGLFGALSMTNHAVLGFRDPIYRSIRELALSYFHEYFLTTTGEKTLRGYSRILNLKQFGTSWITEEKELFHIPKAISNKPHTRIFPKGTENHLRNADSMTRYTASISKEAFSKKRTS